MASDDDLFPGAVLARNGKPPEGFIVHHTAGRGEAKNVVGWWKKQGKGIGSQYIMDRDGTIHDTAKEYGYKGTGQIARGYGKVGAGLSNDNTIGMELVGKDDADITPAQKDAFARFIAARYPTTKLYGHGQVNPHDRQPTEGMTALNAAMALRNGGGNTATAYASPESAAVASPALAAINTAAAPPQGLRINAASAPVAGALAKQEVGPESAGAGGARTTTEGPLDTRQMVYNKLIASGLQPHQALGALYGLGGESATFNTGAYNPRDPGGSIGIAQWNGPRRRALENYAKARGTAVTDPGTQSDFLVEELTNKDAATYQPGVLKALQGTKNAAEATNVWTGKFERPLVNNWQQRFKNGQVGVGTLDANGALALGSAAPSNTSGLTIARAGQAGPRDVAAPPAAEDDRPWYDKAWGKLTAKPEDGGKSPMEKIQEAFARGPENMRRAQEAQAPQSEMMQGPGARNISPGLMNVGQTYGQTINSFSQPLTWSNAPIPRPMPPAGLQPTLGGAAPGVSLNSFKMPYDPTGMGLEINGFE